MKSTYKNIHWPIVPPFLSIRKGIDKANDFFSLDNNSKVIYSPNIDGLFYPDELRGFLADASDDKNIDNPLSLFQVVPENFLFDKNDTRIDEISPDENFLKDILGKRKIIRIDPGRLFSNFHCCTLFRKCKKGKNKDKCYKLDSRIVLLFSPLLQQIDIRKNFKSYYNTLDSLIQSYNDYLHKTNHEHEDYFLKLIPCGMERFYIYYKCRYSNLLEYFFPIFHEGHIIGVIMHGQRFPVGINKAELFPKIGDSGRYEKKLRFSINHLSKKYFQRSPMDNIRLAAIEKRISLLEERITNEVNASARKYVSFMMFELEKTFREQIRKIDVESITALKDFKEVLDILLKKIIETFNTDGFIRIYTILTQLEKESLEDEFVLIGDSTCNKDPRRYSNLSFSTLPNKNDTLEKNVLLKYIKTLPFGFNENRDVFRMDVPFSSKMSYIIWKRYDQWGEKYPVQYEMYGTSLKSMYHTLLEPYIILNGIKLEEKLEASMRLSAHESVQVIPSIVDTINNEYTLDILKNNKKNIHYSSVSIPAHKIIDASNRLMLLEGLFKSSILIFKKNVPDYKWHDLHRMLYSTESLFQLRAFNQNRQKIYIRDKTGYLSNLNLFTDYGSLSHILFNLVDNAIKYGLRASNIFIDIEFVTPDIIEKIFEKSTYLHTLRISVLNYAKDTIEDEVRDKMFDLYYRSPKTNKTLEGMGIGLFLVKKLCNSLEYKIECCKTEKIVDYDICIMYHFLKQNPNYNYNNGLLKSETINLLKNYSLFESIGGIVNNAKNVRDKWEITELELESHIFKPIYINKFQIDIKIDKNIK